MKRILLFVLIGTVLPSGLVVLNYSGFCWSKPGWLSKEEKIDFAISILNQRKSSYFYDGKDLNESKILPYSTVEEFKQKNPNCCVIGNPTLEMAKKMKEEDFASQGSFFGSHLRELWRYCKHPLYSKAFR